MTFDLTIDINSLSDFPSFAGLPNAVKLAASGGKPSVAVAASAHPPVLWSSRRKPGKCRIYIRINSRAQIPTFSISNVSP